LEKLEKLEQDATDGGDRSIVRHVEHFTAPSGTDTGLYAAKKLRHEAELFK
jgi:hypothetical protein